EPLRSAALEGEFADYLLPAVADIADDHRVRNEGVLEQHLVEVGFAGDIADRPYRDAFALEVDEDLAEAVMPAGFVARGGADERDHVVAKMRAAGPDLPPVDLPPAVDLGGGRAERGEIGARVGLAHADAEIAFAAHDTRQDGLALFLRAEPEQQRAALPVGDPVERHGRAGRKQFLGDDVAIQRGPLVAAILLRPGHAEPALGAELAAEFGRVAGGPGIGGGSEAA